MQPGDGGGVYVLAHHQLVAKVERRRIDAAGEELRWIGEVGAVMGDGAAVGDIHGHPVAPTGSSSALPIVGGQWGHVAHQHRIELADVHPQLKRGCADEGVDRIRLAPEQVLQPLALVMGDHRRVLLWPEH